MIYDIVSKVSGAVIAVADDEDEAQYIAQSYRVNPDLEFVGMDSLGREVGRWSISEVVDGALDELVGT